MTDLANRNVDILDGTGSVAFRADVGIDAGRIETIGDVPRASQEIDGQGARNGIDSVHPSRGSELRSLRKLKREYPNTPYLFVTERGGPKVTT